MATNRQTTIVESATLPILGSLEFPDMELIGWCECKEPRETPIFSVFLQPKTRSGYCLHLELELHEGHLPCGSHWSFIKREDVAWLLGYNDPEYEGRNFLVSHDPFWIEAVKKQPCLA